MYCDKITLESGQIRWRCAEDGPPDPATGKRKQIWRRGKTKREAMDRVTEAIRSMKEEGIDQRIGRTMTFDDLAAEWLITYALTGVKRNTVRIREKEIQILNRYVAKMPIGNITHSVYQRVLNDLAPLYARTTLQGVNVTAGMIFRYAIRDKKIKDDPTVGVVIPKKRKTVDEIKNDPVEESYFEREELMEFLDVVRNEGLPLDLERFFTLAFTGMRSGEICALQKDDLDFENNIISITKTLYNETNNMRKYELTPPKTEGSIRDVHVEQPIMDMLKQLVRKRDKYNLQYRHLHKEYHDMDFVFARSNGYPFAPKNIGLRMERLMEKTTIKKHATPHLLRHTHVSMLTEAEVDIATIMARVGHDDMDTTMRIYTHVTQKMQKDASDKLTNLYGNILQGTTF
ncbi:site-specific integrase [Sporosarcina sp. NCCP-2716]|uniref:tyrosine-type recombinase/integrase n=1 Tax=Sporosarcina sp. NCCP-2716 TaxID=2943679 RepID=UPI002040582F|nr:tyrosine-type recombinase/integrase [Sporosarcina sp. NCCP-2716]GKV70228.1 site-specific integrase [Sporosarcina sp. NCCP-2716]